MRGGLGGGRVRKGEWIGDYHWFVACEVEICRIQDFSRGT